MQTLAPLARDHQFLGCPVTLHTKRLARFHHCENANQPGAELIPRRNGARPLFFGGAARRRAGRVQILIRPAGGGGHLLDMHLQFCRGLRNKGIEILKQDPVRIQKAPKRTVGEEIAQIAPENDPVEHGQCAFDGVFVGCLKVGHSASLPHDQDARRTAPVPAPSDGRRPYYAIGTAGRTTFWLRPEAAL